jgi:hypothetical protein
MRAILGVSIFPSSAPSPFTSLKTKRFRNWRLIGVEVIVVVFGFYASLNLTGLLGMVGLGLAVVSFWIPIREIRGITINAQVVSFPRGRLASFPIFSLGGRLTSSPASLRELSVGPTWYGFQVVELQGDFGTQCLVFESRAQRLRFMSAVAEIRPNVPMFRRKSPGRGLGD